MTSKEQFELLLQKLNLSDRKIPENDKAELIKMYESAFGLLYSVMKDVFPYLEETELNDMVADMLAKAVKSSMARDQLIKSTLN